MCRGNGSNVITTLLLLSLVGGVANGNDNDDNHSNNNGNNHNHKNCNCHKQHKNCKMEEEAVVIIR